MLPQSVLSEAGVHTGSKKQAGVYTGFVENANACHRLHGLAGARHRLLSWQCWCLPPASVLLAVDIAADQ